LELATNKVWGEGTRELTKSFWLKKLKKISKIQGFRERYVEKK